MGVCLVHLLLLDVCTEIVTTKQLKNLHNLPWGTFRPSSLKGISKDKGIMC
jgi:hypothetical protein